MIFEGKRGRSPSQGDTVETVVVGGGIAGVCCAQGLSRMSSDNHVILVADSEVLVEVSSLFHVTEHLEELTVFEQTSDRFKLSNPGLEIRRARVERIDFDRKELIISSQAHLSDVKQILNHDSSNSSEANDAYILHSASSSSIEYSTISYDRLCLCTGVRPRLIAPHPNIIGLRDSHSLNELVGRLSGARRVLVVGNGGIALELVHELTFCETIWVIRDHYIGSAFFDASAAAFIMPSLLARVTGEPVADDDLCESKFDRSPTTHQATNSLNGEPCTDSRGMSPAYGLGPECTDSRGRSPAYGLGPEWLARKSLKCRISELEQQREQLLPRQNMQDQSQELPRHKQSICPLKVLYGQEVAAVSDNCGASWQKVSTHFLGPDSTCSGPRSSPSEAASYHRSTYSSGSDSHNDESGVVGGTFRSGEGDRGHRRKQEMGERGKGQKNRTMIDAMFPLHVRTTGSQVYSCDFIVSATGVLPNTEFLLPTETPASSSRTGDRSGKGGTSTSSCKTNHGNSSSSSGDCNNNSIRSEGIRLTDDGYIVVDESFRTNIEDVFAAGDCCCYQPGGHRSAQSRSECTNGNGHGNDNDNDQGRGIVKQHQPQHQPQHQHRLHSASYSNGANSGNGRREYDKSHHSTHLRGHSIHDVANVFENFFQMRLWTQARLMGMQAAQHMGRRSKPMRPRRQSNQITRKYDEAEEGEEEDLGVSTHFELFAHMTRFFGHKVVLLGRFNGQGLGSRVEATTKRMVVTPDGLMRSEYHEGEVDSIKGAPIKLEPVVGEGGGGFGGGSGSGANSEVEMWVRVTPGVEYIKLTVLRGRLVGALLIGDTDLEEVCENLILNRLYIGDFGISLLDPDIDIADYFD